MDHYLGDLYSQLKQLIASKPGERSPHLEDEAEDPKSQPLVWVSKWVDYSDGVYGDCSCSDCCGTGICMEIETEKRERIMGWLWYRNLYGNRDGKKESGS